VFKALAYQLLGCRKANLSPLIFFVRKISDTPSGAFNALTCHLPAVFVTSLFVENFGVPPPLLAPLKYARLRSLDIYSPEAARFFGTHCLLPSRPRRVG